VASRQSQKHALRPHLWGGRAGTCDPPWVFLALFLLALPHSHLFCSVLLHRQKSQQERPGEREREKRERAASRCQACKELIHVKAGRKGAIVTPNHCRPPTSTIRAAHRLLRPSCVSWFCPPLTIIISYAIAVRCVLAGNNGDGATCSSGLQPVELPREEAKRCRCVTRHTHTPALPPSRTFFLSS
jgi:hypothetical protein